VTPRIFGQTWTHALLTGSVAIDVIPVEDCVDADGLVSVADCLEDNDCTTDTCEAEWQAWASDCLGGP